MTRKSIEQTIKKILVEEFEVEEYKIIPEARMKEHIGIDSIDLADIAVIVEKNFGFVAQPDELKALVTLNDFCNLIEKNTTV